jgi:hypothetical protein
MAKTKQSKKEPQKKLVGYQIESRDGKQEIPEEFASFEIIRTKKTLDDFFQNNDGSLWMIVPVYKDDIEGPIFVD